MRARAGHRSRDGYILTAVLGVMLLLTGLMAAGSLLARSALDSARVGNVDLAMAGLTRSGLELAAYQLFIIKSAPPAVDGRRIRFGNGTIVPRLEDEGGKVDLNGSSPQLVAAVFAAAGLDGRAADALLAYVVATRGPERSPPAAGADPQGASQAPQGVPQVLQGASQTPQSASQTPQGVPPAGAGASPVGQAGAGNARRGFQSIDQLMDSGELTRSELRALRPLLTVFNPDGRINIRSADPVLLKAVPGLSQAEAEVILQRRDGASAKDMEALLTPTSGARSFLKTAFGPAYTVRVEATSTGGRKRTVNAVIAASKSPNVPYYALDWWD